MDRATANNDKNVTYCDFQCKVAEVIIRHKSILDIITKLDECNSRINRAVIKSATSCGCISIKASKQEYDKNTLDEVRQSLKNHVEGNLCEVCKEKIEEEMGEYIFYLAALCDTLNISLTDVINTEYRNIKTLGIYNLK